MRMCEDRMRSEPGGCLRFRPRFAFPLHRFCTVRIDIVSLFPELYATVLGTSIPKRAADKGLASYHVTDIRPFGEGNYQKIDDRPFGGGPGMVMMPQVLGAAIDQAEALDPRPARRLLFTPVGKVFDHEMAQSLADEERLLLLAAHYEGYDERVVEEYDFEEISIGDFVLSRR